MTYTKIEDLDTTQKYLINFTMVPTMSFDGKRIYATPEFRVIHYNGKAWFVNGAMFMFQINQHSYTEIYTKEEMPEYFL